MVTNAKEAGTRVTQYGYEDETTVGKHKISDNPLVPNGKNGKGSLEQLYMALVPAAGQETETFLDLITKAC